MALITVCVNTGAHDYVRREHDVFPMSIHTRTGMPFFYPAQAIFKDRVLIFYVCEGSSQPIANQLNMPKNYGINIFDFEGHDL